MRNIEKFVNCFKYTTSVAWLNDHVFCKYSLEVST